MLSVIVVLTLVAACGGNPADQQANASATPAVAPAATPVAAVPTASYGYGFYNPENDGNRTWRWMGKEGTVVLPNPHTDSRLRISVGAPVDKAVLRIELNGEKLDEFQVKLGYFEKTYDVPASKQGPYEGSNIRIAMSETTLGGGDPRQLGLRVFDVSWAQ